MPEQISNLLADAYKSFKWLYENKKESFRRKFENMSDLSVRELTYGDMKICILSMQRVPNFGSVLQGYSLKKMIESLGHEVDFIDIKENDEENNIVYEYEYDDYGNIITIKTSNNSIHTNKSLSYDSLNRLISYNGNDVIYSSVNPWLIQYINGFNLTFDDNKLTRISKNNMDYSYIYDDKGFRIKKINNIIVFTY